MIVLYKLWEVTFIFYFVFLIQVRSNVKSGKGLGCVGEDTCGGNALKFYSAVRLRMVKTGLLKTEDKVQLLRLLLMRSLRNYQGPWRYLFAQALELDVCLISCWKASVLSLDYHLRFYEFPYIFLLSVFKLIN